ALPAHADHDLAARVARADPALDPDLASAHDVTVPHLGLGPRADAHVLRVTELGGLRLRGGCGPAGARLGQAGQPAARAPRAHSDAEAAVRPGGRGLHLAEALGAGRPE